MSDLIEPGDPAIHDMQMRHLILALEVAGGRYGPVSPLHASPCDALREADRVRFALARVRDQRAIAGHGDSRECARRDVLTQILAATAQHARRMLDAARTAASPQPLPQSALAEPAPEFLTARRAA